MKRLALSLTLFATPALADESLPPPRYDIGGNTLVEVMDNWRAMFGFTPPVWFVPWGDAKAQCDAINLLRFGEPYEAVAPGQVLVGCLIRNWDGTAPAIVISVDEYGSGPRLLRHEFGHLLGWPGDHRR